MSRRDRSSRGCRMMSWCWIMRVNLTPRGWGGGQRTSSCGLMEAAWCIHVFPRLQAALCLAEGSSSVTSPPWDTRGKHSVPPSGSDSPFALTQSILAPFLFLSLALFLHLPCQRRGDRGSQRGSQRGQWFRQPGKRSSSFPRPSTPSELLTFAPLH